MRYRFCSLEFRDEIRNFSLGLRNNDITIGSGSSDYIEVTGEDISPMHARLVYTYSGVYLIVLGTTGCRLGEDTILNPGTATLLSSPTQFFVGSIKFSYHDQITSSNGTHPTREEILCVGETSSAVPFVRGTHDNPITLGIDIPLRNRSEASQSGPVDSNPTTTTTITTTPAVAVPTTNEVVAVAALLPLNRSPTPAVNSQNDSWFNKELISCSICLDIMHHATSITPCMHKFCNMCIIRWLATNKTCPRCRQTISKISVDPDFSAICCDYGVAKNIVFPDIPMATPLMSESILQIRRPHRTMQTARRSRRMRPRRTVEIP